MTEPTEEELRLGLMRFGVSERSINKLLEENEISILIAVTEWVLRLKPGLRHLLVVKKISEFMQNRTLEENVKYLAANPCIPSLPSGYEYAKFLAIARIILEHETSLYNSPKSSSQALSI